MGIFRAEADEIVARRINRQVQDEVRRDEVVRALEDEVGFLETFLRCSMWKSTLVQYQCFCLYTCSNRFFTKLWVSYCCSILMPLNFTFYFWKLSIISEVYICHKATTTKIRTKKKKKLLQVTFNLRMMLVPMIFFFLNCITVSVVIAGC